jgi:hypothetical protein
MLGATHARNFDLHTVFAQESHRHVRETSVSVGCGVQVANLRSYAAISLDIMMRWARPLYPDSNPLPPAAEEGTPTDYFFSQRCMCALAVLRLQWLIL